MLRTWMWDSKAMVKIPNQASRAKSVWSVGLSSSENIDLRFFSDENWYLVAC